MTGKPLRLAVIGCGRVFERYHLPAIRAREAGNPSVRLVAACEVDRTRLAWVRATLDGVHCCEGIDDLLAAVPVEAALVSTPPPTHAAIVRRLLDAGVHVLVEKPMALAATDARELVDATRASGLVLRVGFNRRYRPAYRRLRERLRERARSGPGIGRIAFTFLAESSRWGGGAAGADPEFLLHDAGSHALDLVAHVGAAVERVRAVAIRPAGGARDSHDSHDSPDAPDAQDSRVEVEAELAGGIAATCTVGRARRYREELLAEDRDGPVLRVDLSGRTTMRRLAIATDLAWRRIATRPSGSAESFQAQMGAFAAACRGARDDIGAGAAEGLASVRAVDACLRSLAEGGAWCAVQDSNPANSGPHD